MTEVLLGSIDNGNGKSAAICSAIRAALKNPVRFEPVFAPLSPRIGLDGEKSRPKHTLRIDDQVYVFGVEDVYEHGEREKIRRPNNEERYGGPDYVMQLKVLLLQMFAAYRGKDRIRPNLILSVPVEQFNDKKITSDIKSSLCSITNIEDQEGCCLRLKIEPDKVRIIPESSGALAHYAFDAVSLNPRKDTSTVGITAVVDIGFLTTNVSLYEGTAYQKDSSFTIPRGGFGVVVKDIQEKVKVNGRQIEISRLDRALQKVAGIPPKKEKKIDIGGGAKIVVTQVYDNSLEALVNLIYDGLLNGIGTVINRVLISGGGEYHAGNHLKSMMPDGFETVMAPDPELANAIGGYTILRQQAAKAGKFVEE